MPRHRIVCVLLTVCMVVSNTKSEQFVSVPVNGVKLLKRVQTTGIWLNKRRITGFTNSGNFRENFVAMTFNNQDHNNGSGNDICERTSKLTDCNFCEKFISCVKITLLHTVTEAVRLINEFDRHNQSLEVFSGLVSPERNVGSELRSFVKWHQGGVVSEGRTLHLLLMSGITELFQNRSLTFRFIPGITVSFLTKKTGPNLVNVSVKLIHGCEKGGNHSVEAGNVDRAASAHVVLRTVL